MLTNLPYKILIEKSVDDKIDGLLKDLGMGKRCAIICDKNVKKIIGNRIKKKLSSFECDIIDPESIEKNYIEKLAEKIYSFDFVIGLGGGRAIDVAKYSASLMNKPWISFPTVLSHDGIISSKASLFSSGVKITASAKEPISIIADMDTIMNSPYRYIAAGSGDLLSNISAVEDWKIASEAGKERYRTLIADMSLLASDAVLRHVDDIKKRSYHGLEVLLWSLICSGFAMDLYGSSRPCSGSEHNFSHSLDMLNAGGLHGEQCALGTIIMTYLQGHDWKPIKKKMIKLGLPTNARDIGISKDLLVEALVKARDVRDRYTILNEKNITKQKAKSILTKVQVI